MLTNKKISFSYREYESPEELSSEDMELVFKAREAAKNAYAPYSRFMVGAALRLESGIIIHGSNVENAASPSGICAEHNVVAGAVSNHHDDKPAALAIAAVNDEGLPAESVSPCGNCRQVLAEEEIRSGRKIRLILSGRNKTLVVESVSDLLPLGFSMKNLRVNHP